MVSVRHNTTTYMQRSSPIPQAGGYQITSGCPAYPNIRPWQARPWSDHILTFIQTQLKSNDAITQAMVADATTEWLTYAPAPLHHWSALYPIQKRDCLIGTLLKQGRSVTEILAVGIAARLQVEYDPRLKRPPMIPYYRAVQVAKAVRRLLKPVVKTYERESQRYPGTIERTKVSYTRKVTIRSRYAAQRIEKTIVAHSDLFVKRYGTEIATAVLSKIK